MSKILIVTSGSSQLITQIAALQLKETNKYKVYVIYNGLFRESLETFFKQASKLFGFVYVGQINFNINPEKIAVRHALISFLKKENKKLNNEIEKKFKILEKYKKYPLLIIPVRVKVFSDIILINYLRPKKVIFTADGIVDKLPARNFKGLRYCYLKNYLKTFPIKNEIYSPVFLKKDVCKIGIYKEISLNNVFSKLSNAPLIKNFKDNYLKNNVAVVVISQHFHLHENVSFLNDINYFKSIISKVSQDLALGSIILFKPHPRDVKEKIDEMSKINSNNLKIVSEEFQSIPIEFFEEDFLKMKTVFIGGNSSAPLFFKETNKVFSVISNKFLSEDLNSGIKSFAKKHDIDILEV